MSADSIHASVLVFPVIERYEAVNTDEVSQAKPSNVSFTLDIFEPNVVTLYAAGRNSGDDIKGTLHFPDLSSDSPCRNISILPATSLHDDLPKTAYAIFPVIAFAPWMPQCNKEFLDSARDDRSNIKGFLFYAAGHSDTIPDSNNPYWSGIKFRDYGFPIYGIRGRDGLKLMQKYASYSSKQIVLSDINNITGRARIYLEVDTGPRAPLPGLWLFLLIVLAVLLSLMAITSVSMHLNQYLRRRSLRQRVASGEVDLEALGIKRLVVPRRILDKIPLRTYVSSPSPLPASTRLLPNSKVYDQPRCSICLEDFITQTTTVRELSCKHIYHPACIDSFLEAQSSLCPLCKTSTLPRGYVPPQLTNATVRRERYLRRRRQRDSGDGERLWRRVLRLAGTARGVGGVGVGAGANNNNDSNNNNNNNNSSTSSNAFELQPRRPHERRQQQLRGGGGAIPPDTDDDSWSGGKLHRALRAVFPGFG